MIDINWERSRLRIAICQGVVFLDRDEAESLFVLLGHALQDDDIRRMGDESGQEDEQP